MCVQSALLYGGESWSILKRDEARLNVFHHRCLQAILHVSRLDQELHHITNLDLRQRWGDTGLMSDVLHRKRLQWVGHVARMPPDRLPKRVLFGWFRHSRPAHGPRLRWKDRVAADFRSLGIAQSSWFAEAQDRQAWRAITRLLPKQ